MEILSDQTGSEKIQDGGVSTSNACSPLPHNKSTKFQQLYLCLRGPAFHRDTWEYFVTEPEVKTSHMEAWNFECLFLHSILTVLPDPRTMEVAVGISFMSCIRVSG